MTWQEHVGECCGIIQSYETLTEKSLSKAESYFKHGKSCIYRAPVSLEMQIPLVEKLAKYPNSIAVHMEGTVWFTFEKLGFKLEGQPHLGYFADVSSIDETSNITSYHGMRLSRNKRYFVDNSEIVLASYQQRFVHIVESEGFQEVMAAFNSSSGNCIYLYLKGDYQILR
jgi:hypothetical protein